MIFQPQNISKVNPYNYPSVSFFYIGKFICVEICGTNNLFSPPQFKTTEKYDSKEGGPKCLLISNKAD